MVCRIFKPLSLALACLAPSLVPSLALADCASMWVTRNMVADRAGYCFGSVLGQAVFGTQDCVGKDIALTADDSAFVAHTAAQEAAFGCAVDTGRADLDLPLLGQWLQLRDLPRRDFGESACLGYQGAAIPLRAGVADGRMMGEVRGGDTILFAHEGQANHSFVTVFAGGQPVALGWAQLDLTQLACDAYAG